MGNPRQDAIDHRIGESEGKVLLWRIDGAGCVLGMDEDFRTRHANPPAAIGETRGMESTLVVSETVEQSGEYVNP